MGKKKILVVDDVVLNLTAARDVLEDTYEVYEALSAQEAFKILKNTMPDLILLDVIMPVMDGYETVQLLKADPKLRHIPVIFLTADTKAEAEVKGFDYGIVDYITKPFVPVVMKKRIETQINLAEYEQGLEALVAAKVLEIEEMYDLITVSFAGLVESRDGITGGHIKNTSIYFEAFINYLKELPKYAGRLSSDYVKCAIRSAPLHDVGKIAIEDAVLRKSGSLNEAEFDQMKLHSSIGGDTFKYIGERITDRQFAKVAEEMARYHHEKWDGTGYPEGLKGEEIPISARIMSIVDVYDALTSERPYKRAFSHEKSMAMIAEKSGTAFDPDLVVEFVNMGSRIYDCLIRKEQLLRDKQYFVYDKKKTIVK